MTAATRSMDEISLPKSFGSRNGGGHLVETFCATPNCDEILLAPKNVKRAWCWHCTMVYTARGQDPRIEVTP